MEVFEAPPLVLSFSPDKLLIEHSSILYMQSLHPIFSINGEPMRNNIIIERADTFATYIRFRYKPKNICLRCQLAFGSLIDLRNHKRDQHSY